MSAILTDVCVNAMRKARTMRKWFISIAVALLLMAVGAVAYASIPGPDGVIHGCYKTSNPAQGALIAIDSAASCPSGYAALNWNQTGPQGPEGPQGPAGTNGVSGLEYKFQVVSVPADSTYTEVRVFCSSGKTAISGGFARGTRSQDIDIAVSIPDLEPNLTAAQKWLLGFYNRSGQAADLFGYAVCVNVGS